MHRQKPRFESQQHQQHYRQPHYGGGVPQQGPPPNVGQARMPNSAATMRAQGMNVRPTHVGQQQQQQQPQQIQNQQVQQQQAHAGVVQHHQAYPQVSTQGHHTQHTAMYYQHAPHGVPQSYIQISPFPVSVTANPGMPLHPLTQTRAYIPQYTYAFQAGNNQQPTAAYFPAPAATAHSQQMYTAVAPHYVQQQHRMQTASMHAPGQTVANAQQLQQAPVAPSHAGVVTGISAAQHQTQHSHPQQSGVPVAPPQTQQIPRQEQQQGKGRKRNILAIIDPKTGQHVLSDNSNTSATSESNTQVTDGSTKGASSNDTAQSSVPSTADKQDPQGQNSQTAQEGQDAKPKDETVSSIKEDGANSTVSDSKKSSAVRAEFFQKIAQASDDTRSSSTASTSSSSANASSNNNTNSNNIVQSSAETPQPTEPVAEAASTPVPSTPTKEKSPSPEPKQLVANTPVANTSSDDSKDASLVSISPTPIDHYATPRSKEPLSSPPLQPPIEKYAEEEAAEENEPSEDGAVSEEITEPEATEPARQNDMEEISDSVQGSEVRADSELSGSVKQEELDKDEDMEVDEEPEVIEENQPNGHIPMEEGEILDDDDDDDDGEDEPLMTNAVADDLDDLSGSVKGKIKYDRDFLIRIGNQGEGISEFKVADCGLPDLAKDNNLNNHIKPHGIPMGKNSPGGRDYRGPRGMPGMGSKPLMPHQAMQHIRMGNMGMGNWTHGLMVPPPPPNRAPPKVQLTLTREEVKLHKAENAWKPATLKRGASQADPTADDKAIIDNVVKQTRGILNKLTPDNFDKLVQKFMDLPLEDKDERILNVISVVFEKAIDEPSFSTAYAKMVHTVCTKSQETSKKFRKQILDQCQKEFQKSSADEADIKEVEQKLTEATDDESREQLKNDLEEKKYMSRRRSLGNVRFIGELYKLQMLTPKIMVECVHLLLFAPDEEKLECLCKLLTTVGQKLDLQLKSLEDAHARGGNPKFVPEKKWMTSIFTQLKELSENKNFSSRIRFAILDVVELRENDWKPRRDTNAPKTIQEVRNDAMRQEQEEKRQINSLPPVQNNTYGGGGDRDHRAGNNSRLPGSLQQKKSEWTTMPKASRFQTSVKKVEPPGSGLPVFGPPSGSAFGWQRNQSGPPVPSQMKSSPNIHPNLPPRLQNRFQNLSMEDNRSSNKGMPNSSQDSGGYRERDHMSGVFAPHGGPPSLHSVTSPPPSMSSSAENSRPVSPKDNPEVTADTSESVKNIFQEYLASKKFDDTLHWIKGRFPGNKIQDFIEEISRQVAEMSKEVQQKCAGNLVRLLIKNREIGKEKVIQLMAQGVMEDLGDIRIDSPMATSYLAQFLVEIFSDENNLDWLVQVGNKLIDDENDEAWKELAVNSLNLLKLRNNEENVQTSFKKTENKNVIPVDEIPWLQERTTDSLAEQIVKVLSPKVNSESSEEIGQLFQEHSWDVREEVTARALTEAICRLTWNSETGSWEDERVKKLLPLLDLPNPKMFPTVWKQVEEFSKRKSIERKKSEGLWSIMYSLNMTTTGSD